MPLHRHFPILILALLFISTNRATCQSRPPSAELATLLCELDSDDPLLRDSATRDLLLLGPSVIPHLKKLNCTTEAELQARIKYLIGELALAEAGTLVFAVSDGVDPGIWRSDLLGHNQRRIAIGDRPIGSSAGHSIAYWNREQGEYRLRRLWLSSGLIDMLVSREAAPIATTWSPNEEYICWASASRYGFELVVLNIEQQNSITIPLNDRPVQMIWPNFGKESFPLFIVLRHSDSSHDYILRANALTGELILAADTILADSALQDPGALTAVSDCGFFRLDADSNVLYTRPELTREQPLPQACFVLSSGIRGLLSAQDTDSPSIKRWYVGQEASELFAIPGISSLKAISVIDPTRGVVLCDAVDDRGNSFVIRVNVAGESTVLSPEGRQAANAVFSPMPR